MFSSNDSYDGFSTIQIYRDIFKFFLNTSVSHDKLTVSYFSSLEWLIVSLAARAIFWS